MTQLRSAVVQIHTVSPTRLIAVSLLPKDMDSKPKRTVKYPVLSLLLVIYLVKPTHSFKGEFKDQINAFVQEVMKCRNVPAMSVSVVAGPDPGDTYARGYGMADIRQNIQADETTKFAVGSLTKAFTVTLVASLLSDTNGKYNWDTPVRDIMGDDFHFVDQERTKFATIRDLAAHRLGLYNYFIAIASGLDDRHAPMEYCKRMRFLQPYRKNSKLTSQLRTDFIYSNAMYMLLGCVAEKLGGDSYGNLLRKRILEPLNMTSLLFRDVVNWTSPDYAQPYVFYNGSLVHLSNEVARALEPLDAAGALLASSEDMVKWLRYHMGLSGVDLASQVLIQQTYQPQTVLGPLNPFETVLPLFPFYDESFAYNMGWMSGSYQGYRFFGHNGIVSAYGAELRVFRDTKLGIFVDTSGPMYTDALYARYATIWFISDLLLGLNPVVNATSACNFPRGFTGQENSASINSRPAIRDPLPLDEDIIELCVGTYGHLFFGNVTVTRNPSKPGYLDISFGKLLRATLGATPWVDPSRKDLLGGTLHGDLWFLLETGPTTYRERGVLLYALFQDKVEAENGFQTMIMRLPVNRLQGPLTFTRRLNWDGSVEPFRPDSEYISSANMPFPHRIFALIHSITLLSFVLLAIA